LEVIIGVTIVVWGLNGTDARLGELLEGLDNIARFIIRLFPPELDWVQVPLKTTEIAIPLAGITLPGLGFAELALPVPLILIALIETIQMAVIGTLIAIVLSLPFGLLAAQNTSPSRWVYQATRFMLNMNRAIPNIIFALIFVSAVGLGPFGGVLALGIGSIGFMAKLYAESIEAIDPQQVLAVRATGAGPLQTFMYAVVPQALPLIASYSLYLFETNVRSASILGLVGAGGVGFQMGKYMALFQYRKLTGALILVIVMVTLLDRGSAYLRKKII
jgi:phosphonate transport system permease protein